MRPIEITSPAADNTGSFTTQPVVLDPYTNAQSVTVIASLVGSGQIVPASLELQASNDDPFAPTYNPANGHWVNVEAFGADGTVTAGQSVEAVINAVPRLIRFKGTSCVVGSVVTFKIIQGGLGSV
jgi:hypothetical protein